MCIWKVCIHGYKQTIANDQMGMVHQTHSIGLRQKCQDTSMFHGGTPCFPVKMLPSTNPAPSKLTQTPLPVLRKVIKEQEHVEHSLIT